MVKPVISKDDFQGERFAEPFGDQVRSKEEVQKEEAKKKTQNVFKDVKKDKTEK